MQETGVSALWAVLASLLVYTGAFQFVLVSFISSGASSLTVALTALAINSRHIFYGVSFVETFREMKKRYPYMIFSLTDETYALSCSLETPEGMDRKKSVVSDCNLLSWVLGVRYFFRGADRSVHSI